MREVNAHEFEQIPGDSKDRQVWRAAVHGVEAEQQQNCGPPGSSVHGILQARILEWIEISSSKGSS